MSARGSQASFGLHHGHRDASCTREAIIDDKVVPMPALRQACNTKVFLADGSQCPPMVHEALFGRVQVVLMRVMFVERRTLLRVLTYYLTWSLTGLSPTLSRVCMTEWLLVRSKPKPSHSIVGTTVSW